MKTSPEINEIATALSKVQQEGLLALKDSNNPFFKSKYADLSSVWEVLRKPLTDNGLSVAQPMSFSDEGHPIILTMLMHTSGQWISGECLIKPDKETPQAYGSAITYARRYSLAAMCGVCPEDDDAESAMQRKKTPPKNKYKEPQTVKTVIKDDPGFPKSSKDATKNQYKKIFEAAQQCNMTDSELTELANWYKAGEILSAKEADEMIEDMQGVLNRYLDYIETLKK